MKLQPHTNIIFQQTKTIQISIFTLGDLEYDSDMVQKSDSFIASDVDLISDGAMMLMIQIAIYIYLVKRCKKGIDVKPEKENESGKYWIVTSKLQEFIQ
jgi:hypothetical protein